MNDQQKNLLNLGTTFSFDEGSIKTLATYTALVAIGAIVFNWALHYFFPVKN